MKHFNRYEDEDDWRQNIDRNWSQDDYEEEEEWNNRNDWDEDDEEDL